MEMTWQECGGICSQVVLNVNLISFRRSTLVFSEKGITLQSLATSTLPFTIIWEATNYMYLRALGIILPTDVTALFSSAPAFVYILSFFILREPLLVLRVCYILYN